MINSIIIKFVSTILNMNGRHQHKVHTGLPLHCHLPRSAIANNSNEERGRDQTCEGDSCFTVIVMQQPRTVASTVKRGTDRPAKKCDQEA